MFKPYGMDQNATIREYPDFPLRVSIMAKLVYSTIMSLDGYTADENGNFDWCVPDEEMFAFINNLEREVGTYLYGRRMYETMVYWETHGATEEDSPSERDFTEIWRAADKIVYSRTLMEASSARTTIEHEFDPEAVRRMKQTSGHDVSVSGPDLASQMMAAGLLDEMHLFVAPVAIGGGNPALSRHFDSNLELLNANFFASGDVHLHYRTSR
jgi:dihydrofolate reductase